MEHTAPEPTETPNTIKRDPSKRLNILLLTNRDSDNTGDQVIEECDKGLVKLAMKNLGYTRAEYKIQSSAASMVNWKYLDSGDPKDLSRANRLVRAADVVLFGGAPLFNYRYQIFYKRTAVTIGLAQKYGKPVIFSAIGVESYDEDSEKCQELKEALNLPCVRQITTRDNFEALKLYKERDDLEIARVADPAVFTRERFRKFAGAPAGSPSGKPKVGLFIIRANAFVDNGVDFDRVAAANMWVNLTRELEKRGLDYVLLTSGHFGDEAFMQHLVDDCGLSAKKAVLGVNKPEDLVSQIASCDAIVTARLHPSIVSYSLEVPAVSISWNPKVDFFYEAIGHPDRVIHVADGAEPGAIADKVQQALAEGTARDGSFDYTVYESLFHGLKGVFKPDEDIAPYGYEKVLSLLPSFKGTSKKEADAKIRRKFRRTYRRYNKLFEMVHSKNGRGSRPHGLSGALRSGIRKIVGHKNVQK